MNADVQFLALSVSGAAGFVAADVELDQVSLRERQVLRLIARGYSYQDIATELTISPKTVESHVSSVLRKLQLSNRHQLTNWVSQRPLL